MVVGAFTALPVLSVNILSSSPSVTSDIEPDSDAVDWLVNSLAVVIAELVAALSSSVLTPVPPVISIAPLIFKVVPSQYM